MRTSPHPTRLASAANSKIQPGAPDLTVALSAGQGPTATSVGIHYGQPDRTAVACFGSPADVARVTQ